jgi:hypothetical protein
MILITILTKACDIAVFGLLATEHLLYFRYFNIPQSGPVAMSIALPVVIMLENELDRELFPWKGIYFRRFISSMHVFCHTCMGNPDFQGFPTFFLILPQICMVAGLQSYTL